MGQPGAAKVDQLTDAGHADKIRNIITALEGAVKDAIGYGLKVEVLVSGNARVSRPTNYVTVEADSYLLEINRPL